MVRKVLIILSTIALSIFILFISITQTAQIRYSFGNGAPAGSVRVLGNDSSIDYYFPYPGRILPDHPLWSVKAVRDKLWLGFTPKAERRAELDLLFSNKRLVSSKILFEKDKPELAFSTLTKSQKYLESAFSEEETARAIGVDTKSFLYSASLATLKQMEVIKELLMVAPDDAKPGIITVGNKIKTMYGVSAKKLQELKMTPPTNPFNGES